MLATIITAGRYPPQLGQWYFIVSGEMVVVAAPPEGEN